MFNSLKETTLNKMWEEELNVFKKNYERFLKVKIEDADDGISSKKKNN